MFQAKFYGLGVNGTDGANKEVANMLISAVFFILTDNKEHSIITITSCHPRNSRLIQTKT
jgi:hypothetical protein